ncbi:kinase-like domain-containing protein [Absidia repens]|uniref:Serine/threonine-protein kinase n=1 Tax=Absidia repens TaxID=90262 RepID=A0A1X2IQG8_9FUNG|nr:kinase-like domain-containing protein [Absidia repens]
MNRQRQNVNRPQVQPSSNVVGSVGVTIPRDPPLRPANHPASSTATSASAAAIFKKLDRENRPPLADNHTGAGTATTNTIQRLPLRQSNRNKHTVSNSKNNNNSPLDRLTTPNAIKKPTTNIRATQSPKPLQPQPHQLQRKRAGHGNRIPVVTDEEVPVTMVDKDHGVTYTKLQLLGEGGFARCYQVRDQDGNLYAAKIVAKASLEQQRHRIKLHGEIITHGSMKHQRIVQFFSCFEDDNNVYLIMELCENKTLIEMLKARRHLTEPETRYYLVQLLDACRYMHEKMVVHRDIKLSNIFLDHKMNIKLGDFGLSAMLETPEDRKRTVCGTPNYMAPEILFGNHRHNQKADIWALGVVLYTLLTGSHPFQMEDHNEIYRKIRANSKKPTYVFSEQGSTSSEAKDLVSKMLVNDPDERLSISDILQHPFIQHQELPTRIPHSALQGRPTLQFLRTSSEDPASSSSQLNSQHASSDKKLIVTLASALTKALLNKDSIMARRKGTPIEPIVWTKHNAFLSRWVDFTSKYGLGYSISDGEMGVLFNDSTTLSTFDEITYRYIAHGSPPIIQEFQHTDIPTHLRKKQYLMTNFKEYMDEKLACLATNRVPGDTSNGIYLSKYVVTEEAVVFRLSNNILQFNFFSRPKLMFMEYGTKIIYVDQSRKLKMYELTEAIATGDRELLYLLTYAKDTLQAQIQDS